MNFDWEQLDYSSYNPNLEPSDFFVHMVLFLGDQDFNEVKEAVKGPQNSYLCMYYRSSAFPCFQDVN